MPEASRRRRAAAFVVATLLALPIVSLTATPAAAQASVSTAADLRAAVAGAATTITLGANITLDCATGPLAIDRDLTLTAATGTMRTLTVDDDCRIIEVTNNAEVTIERLHLTGGVAPNGDDATVPGTNGQPGGDGGAIESDGDIILVQARFSANQAGHGGDGQPGTPNIGEDGGDGGAGGSGGAIFTTGTVTATDTSFDGNHAGDGGNGANGSRGADGTNGDDTDPATAGDPGGAGGIGGAGGAGGAIAAGTEIVLVRSTLEGNSAGRGGNGGNGGNGGDGGDATDPAEPAGGTGGNTGAGGNGGNGGSGGAISSADLDITTSTIHANSTGSGGTAGIAGPTPGTGGNDDGGGPAASGITGGGGTAGNQGSGGAISGSGTVDIVSATITANTSANGSARSLAGGTINLDHTLVAGSGDGVDCAGAINQEHSIDGDGTCDDAETEATLNLYFLADNGGHTKTRLPDTSSPLFDGGDATCPTSTDQRGITRPQGGACDIGAVERRGVMDGAVTATAPESSAPVGQNLTVVFTLAFDDDSTGSVAESELVVTINECPNPTRGGDAAPWTAGDDVTYTCVVTSNQVEAVWLAFEARFPDNETTRTLTASLPLQFTQATTTTAAPTTTAPTTTTIPVVVGDAAGTGGNLPRTGLSILVTLLTGGALLFGGSTMSRVAKTRAERSPRWDVKYGVPYPVGTVKKNER